MKCDARKPEVLQGAEGGEGRKPGKPTAREQCALLVRVVDAREARCDVNCHASASIYATLTASEKV